MRWTRAYIPTLKEDPAEAEIISHRLMIRAGVIDKVGAGLYTLLPLGLRVVHKIEQIIREEMNRAGATEFLLPTITPAALWHESGRWDVYGQELLRLKDRHGVEFCYGPTHEEGITSTIRNVLRSYKQLPVNLYQIQSKFRDERRPRFGVMRGREFLMKDAYSFDKDREGLDTSYEEMHEAYSKMFTRCGLRFRPVLGDPGEIGGSMSHEFMVLAENGESRILSCPDDACGYAATDETAESRRPEHASKGEAPGDIEKVHTPGKGGVEDVAEFLNVDSGRLIKTLLYKIGLDGEEVVAALVPGDRELNEPKLKKALGTAFAELADEATVRTLTNAPVGYAGPVGLNGTRIIADIGVERLVNAITGANEGDHHLINVQPGRDFTPESYVDIATVESGDGCPQCDKALEEFRGIEVGQIFKLGTKYSDSLKATYQDEDGSNKPFVMGCYGIGITRTLGAAVEQNNDENGIIWPMGIAPFHVLITPTIMKNEDVVAAAEGLYAELSDSGLDVLLDDRADRAGVKFKDGDLIGIPYRVTVGPKGLEKGEIEFKDRRTGDVDAIPLDNAAAAIRERLGV